jgi:uncharacterized membrane protein
MIDLTIGDLKQIAQVLMVANTPISLLKGLLRSSAMTVLERCQPELLLECFEKISTRARQSEIAVALEYALLAAILTRSRDPMNAPVDASRLSWAEDMRAYLSLKPVTNTESMIIRVSPTVQSFQSTSATLFAANGEPLLWRGND